MFKDLDIKKNLLKLGKSQKNLLPFNLNGAKARILSVSEPIQYSDISEDLGIVKKDYNHRLYNLNLHISNLSDHENQT